MVYNNGVPRKLQFSGVDALTVARLMGKQVLGPVNTVNSVSGLGPDLTHNSLVYLSEESFAKHLYGTHSSVVTNSELAKLVPADCSVIEVDSEPKGEWGNVLVGLKRYREIFPSYIDKSVQIHKTAKVGTEVYLDENVIVRENSNLIGPLYVGKNSVIGPGAVIGNDGFELSVLNGKQNSIVHMGGVWISSEVEIRSNVVIDKSFDGGFTFIGSGTKIDSQVFLAHAVEIGNNCVIIAGSKVAGSTIIGANSKLMLNSSIAHGIKIGDHSVIGIGAVVMKDVPSNAVIMGHHRLIGFRCLCGRSLLPEDSDKTCKCGYHWSK
jgi:UDP-3-O-[3-hydroxymyristoyl] glucosamine N-acyltransferase